MFRKLLSFSVAVLFLMMSTTSGVLGASKSGGNGLKISPVRTDLVIAPGKSTTVKLIVQNITKYTTTFAAQINNFSANGETGTPVILTGNSPHSIKSFISPIPEVTIRPNQSKAVDVNIHVPGNISGGGYYGAVRFIAINSTANKTLDISASVASLILITVPGPSLNEQLQLSHFTIAQNGGSGGLFFSNKNITATSVFYNSGNVQTEPFGKITVQNSSGKNVFNESINTTNPPGNVLPQTSRAFTLHLSSIGTFGKYTVYGNFGYGSKGQLLSAKATFFVVPAWMIILAIVIVILIITLIWLMPRIFRAWYRRSIKKAK